MHETYDREARHTGPPATGARERGAAPGPTARRNKATGGSFTSRMEDRFRRRFDE